MTRAFQKIAFTHSVKAAQKRYGNRQTYNVSEDDTELRDSLTQNEISFLSDRDSFYMATVGENGWPYVQHRGGPKGFLKVLDENTIGFADFRGNKQYISVGNMNTDDRVMLFLMDYPHRLRLKIWAHSQIFHPEDAPEQLTSLINQNYAGHIERCIILKIAAFDWNCAQHITPRYSKTDIEAMILD
ncbi:pyridoxamine 5'-phosphate oxidase family protein [Methylomonas sp. AM2-LC]|uniref:pyridoxamine 5'-phosphate oxidase family protein n=1 Tax=Methylomonas sp. AM2-LC TaxID=3153301 RepID=UPI0032635F11